MLSNIKFILFSLKKLMASGRCRTLSAEHAAPLDKEKYVVAISLDFFTMSFFAARVNI